MSEQRLIDANAFYKQLEEIRAEYIEENTMSSIFAAEIIETVQDSYLKDAPTIDPLRHGEWISVKDRLPEGTGDYLIIYSREICRPEMAVAFFSAEDAEDCPYDTNYGFEYTTYGDHKDVLYWMPLPEMPMEENDKE